MSNLIDYQKKAATNGVFPSEKLQVNSKHSERVESIPDVGIYTNGIKVINWLFGLIPFIAFFSTVANVVYKGKKSPLVLMKTSH